VRKAYLEDEVTSCFKSSLLKDLRFLKCQQQFQSKENRYWFTAGKTKARQYEGMCLCSQSWC